ncbi:tetratricopeptide repeat protein [Uliginosibacterium sp. H1]|uniref:tetratricopeptide repeat protein n=1 Tax=Uliginosibacterium sp. H1 TaxID=3114757 RepID=UPI002E175D00|nr:tetratricopeptide repeat protein [Uliginosibacterium sp. H1]
MATRKRGKKNDATGQRAPAARQVEPPEASATQLPLQRWLPWAIVALLFIAGIGAWWWQASTASPPAPSSSTPATRTAAVTATAAAQYVGSAQCSSCHQAESAAWETSQHKQAMQHADAQTVLGNFADARFRYAGVESRFTQRDGKYYVTTDGPDGKLAEYAVKYTYGVSPLQQYLIEFPDGRLQALSIAWDTRAAKDGGQRWFHLYPQERVDFKDELHWTKRRQNWNHMCADCHSTDVRKGYDASTDRFDTKWSELTVGCEACHGPASAHIGWAGKNERERSADKTAGLVVNYHERRGAGWAMDLQTGIAKRTVPRSSHVETDMCAQCHARRAQLAEGYRPGQPFTDHYLPSLPLFPLYHVDGQQRDEVYIWGSFLQSRMNAAGVTCSDCHNPHTGKPKAEGNALCAQCHLPAKFDTPDHHRHASVKAGSPGTQCVDCHMPQTSYMVNDPRRDHSFRPPRPDISVAFGTPNACNQCHTGKPAQWAAAAVEKWFGKERPAAPFELAAAFHAAEHGGMAPAAQLLAIASDPARPGITRAAAIERLGAHPSDDMLAAVQKGLGDVDAMVRHASLGALEALPPEQRLPLAAPLLRDPRRMVRIEAARVLGDTDPATLTTADRDALTRATDELEASHRLNADQAESVVAIAGIQLRRGQPAQAESTLRQIATKEPTFVPAWANLADLLRRLNREADAEAALREGLKHAPDAAALHHSLGLSLVRQQRLKEALPELAAATRARDATPRYSYVYAVALHSAGRSREALAILDAQLKQRPGDSEVAQARAAIAREAGGRR